jgi:hypothetical protein
MPKNLNSGLQSSPQFSHVEGVCDFGYANTVWDEARDVGNPDQFAVLQSDFVELNLQVITKREIFARRTRRLLLTYTH